MAQEKPSLETLLSTSAGKKFLFLGREGIYTKDEIARFLKKYNITMTQNNEEGVVGIVEHHQLNPVEEDISDAAYEKKIPLYKLSGFEKFFSKNLNSDELLMGIKLGNDQDRIFRLLGSADIEEELFLKLLEMYEWDEDEEDNTKDRDVVMSTLRRYIKIKPNEEDLLYSYLTLRRLATEATNPKVLHALLSYPNYSFLVRGKAKTTLRETVAKNLYIDKDVITKLVRLRDEKVDVAMVGNPALSLDLLQKLAAKERMDINEAMATNPNIDDMLFEKLLSKEEKTVQLLLLSQTIDSKRLELIDTFALSKDIFATLGANEQLSEDVINTLIQREELSMLKNLCSNETLSSGQIEQLYNKGIAETYTALARNVKTAVMILETLYENYHEQIDMLVSLAYNKCTPEGILRALYEKDLFKINQALATNAALPMELLDILKVDTRLQNELAQNEIFVKEYEAVFEYDGNAIR